MSENKTKEQFLKGKTPDQAWEAIDEYCDQEKRSTAIVFAEWISTNIYLDDQEPGKWYNPAGDAYSTEQLYDLYLLSLPK